MKLNDLRSDNEKIFQNLGKILYEILPALPLEFGPVTFPGPRAIARELAIAKTLIGEQTNVEAVTQALPPPPAPKVEIPPPSSPKPMTSRRPVLERRGL